MSSYLIIIILNYNLTTDPKPYTQLIISLQDCPVPIHFQIIRDAKPHFYINSNYFIIQLSTYILSILQLIHVIIIQGKHTSSILHWGKVCLGYLHLEEEGWRFGSSLSPLLNGLQHGDIFCHHRWLVVWTERAPLATPCKGQGYLHTTRAAVEPQGSSPLGQTASFNLAVEELASQPVMQCSCTIQSAILSVTRGHDKR